MNKEHEYSALGKTMCDGEYEYYIWGAGITGKLVYQKLKDYIPVIGFIDKDVEKQSYGVDHIPVFSPKIIDSRAKNVRYLISPAFYGEIACELKSKGLQENVDFFHSLTFARIFLLYKYNEAVIYRTDISITEKCTLKCKKCNMFMPHFKNPRNRELALLKEDVDAYFDKVAYVFEFKVLGGEPFMYPDLQEFLCYLMDHYADRIGRVEIFTNATLRASEELLKFIKERGIWVGITDYTNTVPYQKRLEEFRTDLEQYQIPYRCDKAETWADFGFPDAPYNLEGEEKLIQHFDACHFEGRGLYDKRLYFCHMFTSAVRCGLYADSEEDSIALASDVSKAEIVEFEMGYCKKGYHDFCRVCRGCRSTIEVPAGEQV